MQIRKLLPYVFQGLVIGLLAGLIFVYFFGAETTLNPVIEFKEAVDDAPANVAGVNSYANAVERAAPAVVNIFTTKIVTERLTPFDDPALRRFFGDRAMPEPRRHLENSLGSGVIVSPQGYILTSNHVIDNADEIQIAVRDGRNGAARVVGTDPETDLAVLKVDLPNLPAITIGQSDKLRVGDVLLAIGNPFGVGQTVTMGIVSATGRNQLGISTFENFIQTDAAINPGNSGGALVNAGGHLIGINTAIFSQSGGSQGIGFAIPLSLAKNVMQEIIEHGHVIRGWLGVEVQDITPELAESFNLEEKGGALIAGVLRDGPAGQAGLRPGDVIFAVEGKQVSDARMLMNAVAQVKPGKQVKLSGMRDGKKFSLETKVGERPPPSR